MSKINLEMDFAVFRDLMILCTEKSDPDLDPLRRILKDKLQKMVNHDLYTTYKTAATAAEREAARQRYLDEKGIPESFRW